MAIVTITEELRLPYAPADLAALVADVTTYPSFIKYVQSIELHGRTPLAGGGWEGLARAVIGWRQVRERFGTWVTYRPELCEVRVRLAEGPFRHLENLWRFAPAAAGGVSEPETAAQGSVVTFWLAYEFKNPILQALASVNRRLAADRIIQAFTAEAHRRFGGGQV